MGDLFKRPIVIGIVVVAILAAVIWSYFDNRAEQKRLDELAAKQADSVVISNLTNTDPVDFDEFVREEYTLARSKAEEINQNYKLSAIVIELPSTLAVNSGSDRYVFSSAKDKSNNWVITLDQLTQNYLRATIPKSDYLGEVVEIDTELWKFNFVTALQLAEKNGGKEWRENNTLLSATLTLKHGEPSNFLAWTIEYDAGSSTFTRKFDANSGKLLES